MYLASTKFTHIGTIFVHDQVFQSSILFFLIYEYNSSFIRVFSTIIGNLNQL